MAGTCNSVRCLPTSALSRAEVTGDFGGSLMRQSSKVRVHAPIMEFTKSGSSSRHAVRPKSANFGRSSRMTSATPVASISRYRRNAIIRYGNRAGIFSGLTEPRKPDVCGGATRHARQWSNERANGDSICLVQRMNSTIRIPSLSRWSITNKLVRIDHKLTGGRKTQRARQGSSCRTA